MSDSIFDKLISGEIPCYKVYEDEHNLSFLDNKPHTKGHTIVIPKKKGVTIFDHDSENLNSLILAVKKTMEILKDKLHPDGFNVGWNHGTAGGQVVPHLHIHIMPRYNGDGGGSMHSIISNPGNLSAEEVAQLLE